MNDSRESRKADSREAANGAKKSDESDGLRVFAPSRERVRADSREAAKDAKKSVDGQNLRVFAPSRERVRAESREAAKDAKKSGAAEGLRVFAPSRERVGAESREAAKDAKKSGAAEGLRVFASSREGEIADSREAAKDAKKIKTAESKAARAHPGKPRTTRNTSGWPEEESLRAFASSRETSSTATPERLNVEELSAVVVDCAYKLHVEVGPGLLESVYDVVLARMIQQRGVPVKRQVPVPIQLLGMQFEEGFRADLLVDERLVVELKSTERLMPVHAKQLLTYLRLLDLPLGLLINFGAPTFREGVKRIVNRHVDFASSRLRVNQEPLTGSPS